MTLDDIINEWVKDAPIKALDAGQSSLDIAKIEGKYLAFIARERLILKKYKMDFADLKKAKLEWYKGIIDYQEQQDRGWPAQPLKILNTDLPIYMDADKEIVALILKIGVQEEKVSYLDQVIKTLKNRHWTIRNYIEDTKFKNGG